MICVLRSVKSKRPVLSRLKYDCRTCMERLMDVMDMCSMVNRSPKTHDTANHIIEDVILFGPHTDAFSTGRRLLSITWLPVSVLETACYLTPFCHGPFLVCPRCIIRMLYATATGEGTHQTHCKLTFRYLHPTVVAHRNVQVALIDMHTLLC
jgi:hypothetical protein